MKRKAKGMRLVAALCALAILAGCNGQDPEENTHGAMAAGPQVSGKTNVVLTGGTLTFDIPPLAEAEDPMHPAGSYTLEMALKNTAGAAETVQLALRMDGADAAAAEGFAVEADGVPVETVLHQTRMPRDSLQGSATAWELPEQETHRNGPLTGNLTVTQYTYTLTPKEDIEYGQQPWFRVELDPAVQRLIVPETTVVGDGELWCSVFDEYPENGEKQPVGDRWFTFFVVGEPLSAEPEWRFIVDRNSTVESITPLQTETMTFAEMLGHAQVKRALSAAKLDTKGLNATERTQLYRDRLTEMLDADCYDGALDLSCLNGPVLYWLEYCLTLGPSEELVHTVTGPMYPTVYTAYKPYKYGYDFDIATLNSWARQGSLTFDVHTSDVFVPQHEEDAPPADDYPRLVPLSGEEGGPGVILCTVPDPKLRFKLANYLWVFLGIAGVLVIFGVVGWYPQWKFRKQYKGEYRGKKG